LSKNDTRSLKSNSKSVTISQKLQQSGVSIAPAARVVEGASNLCASNLYSFPERNYE
jgi:hypothetical protein